MRTIVNSRGMLVGLALLATAGMTACSANRPPSFAGPGTGQTTTSSPAAAAAAATTATSPPAAAPSARPAVPGGAQNLVITSAERSALTTAYLAFRGRIPLSDVAGEGPMPGSVYYAYDSATNTYWALADFEPSSTASFDVMLSFQDGGGIAMFQKVGAAAWGEESPGVPPFCGEAKFFPQTVLLAWGMSAPPDLTC